VVSGELLGGNISTTTNQFIPFHFTTETIVVVLFVCIFSVLILFLNVFACFLYFAIHVLLYYSAIQFSSSSVF